LSFVGLTAWIGGKSGLAFDLTQFPNYYWMQLKTVPSGELFQLAVVDRFS
jgi:hypothetical protein